MDEHPCNAWVRSMPGFLLERLSFWHQNDMHHPRMCEYLQRPRRQIRHLKGIEGRNISTGAPFDLSTSACYFALWQYTAQGECGVELQWVYTSEQVSIQKQTSF